MQIKDILQRDPATHPLVNQGQARITDTKSEKEMAELRAELATFVCEGQYAEGIQKILSSYLSNLGQTSQKAAWVSGFFGSGKSHFEKMLAHLWVDTPFPDGTTARSLVPSMPDDLRSLLRELDTAGKRAGGVLAAAGALPSGTTDHVRLTILSILLRGVGLPASYPQAQFCLWLHEQGWYEKVRSAVESAGKVWESELNNLYVSGHIARALLECDSNFAASEAEARQTLRSQFPARTTDLTTAEFLTAFKKALKLAGRDRRLPCTVLILDEVQQYIGDSNDRSTLVTEVAEAVSKQLDSHVIVIGAGQSALTEVRLLHKLMDRFTIRVPLSDADVETVTRKVLLQKKPTSIVEVRTFLDTHSGEISRQLQGTRIGEMSEDRDVIVDDYPLLPVRRRFWEQCFRQVDAAGTHSQLRSQLRIIHDALTRVSGRNLGAVVPADDLYEALAPEMVNTGVLLREINEKIIGLSKDGSEEGRLARRICGLVFLIGKLAREAGADIGVRASKEHISDLLVDDLLADNGKLRSAVGTSLEKLANTGVLMKVGDEYRLQTKEGAEWDREFRNRQTRLVSDDVEYHILREQQLYSAADKVIRSIRVIQGESKESRSVLVSREATPPTPSGEGIPLWIRDGWTTKEKEVVDAARAAGMDSPTVFVFIPLQAADELRKLVIEAEAARLTIDAKGATTTDEGKEARRSMESRRDVAKQRCDELIEEIASNTKVFQGGGSELLQSSFAERLKEASNAALVRLFPRFREADSAAWESVIRRARDGADQPFQPVGHMGATEQHPVCREVLSVIGAGKLGSDIRKDLRKSPYGWPQDAIDAALIALHRSQHLSAILNGAAVAAGQLDQNKISKSEFKVERVTLSVTDRLAIRKLFQDIDISCKAGDEGAKAQEFIASLLALAAATGGEPPLPKLPQTTDIEDLRALTGNELLAAIRDKKDDLATRMAEWKKTKALIGDRLPAWKVVESFAKHARSMPVAEEEMRQVEAIISGRHLLEATDPVSPLRVALSGKLRGALLAAQETYEKALGKGLSELDASDLWQKIKPNDRSSILDEVGLNPPEPLQVATDTELIAALDRRSLEARQAEADAVPGRVQRALEKAAKLLEPKVRAFSIERATLRTDEDVERWINKQKKRLLEAVKDGPILVN